ncbi:MAG: ABC transporter permease [Gemmatimonadota bacterium]
MGSRWGIVLPGLPQLLRGKFLEGGVALVLWLGLLGSSLYRFDRILRAPFGDLEEWVALLTLVGVLGGVWWWSFVMNARHRLNGHSGGGKAWAEGWRAFRANRMAMMGLGIVCVLYLAMLLAPFLAPFEPEAREAFEVGGDMAARLAPPSSVHPMGTDQYSQDVLSRILYGARITLTLGLLAVGMSLTVGVFLGAVAGYWGGRLDAVIMRFVDMVMAFPRLVLLIAIVALFTPSVFVVVVALAFTQWPFTTRMVRGEIIALKEREFAEAARAMGFSPGRILFGHLLPNALGPLIVVATLGIGNVILLEAGLSFLGLGLQASTPSWGFMVSSGRDYMMDAWWVSAFPGLAIVLAVLAFNLVGDGLRDALDPRQRKGVNR